MKRTEYRLFVTYSSERWPEMDGKLYKMLGCSHASGMGRNERDLAWYYPSLAQATAAWRKINRFPQINTLSIERFKSG